jgi:hypothetical protein
MLIIALKTDENLITLAANFETKHIISTLSAYLYFLSGSVSDLQPKQKRE